MLKSFDHLTQMIPKLFLNNFNVTKTTFNLAGGGGVLPKFDP